MEEGRKLLAGIQSVAQLCTELSTKMSSLFLHSQLPEGFFLSPDTQESNLSSVPSILHIVL